MATSGFAIIVPSIKKGLTTIMLAERIQSLRRAKGISQEELADAIGVSRQAVSKWESGQNSPDVEKIILLSDFFAVTTDYLLKGIELQGAESPRKPSGKQEKAGICAAAATALNFIGLILASAIWYELQTAAALAAGLIFMVLGCMIYGVGMAGMESQPETGEKIKGRFWTVNIWILSFIPLSFFYNILSGLKGSAPYPLPVRPLYWYGLFWLVYFAVCLTVVWKMNRSR